MHANCLYNVRLVVEICCWISSRGYMLKSTEMTLKKQCTEFSKKIFFQKYKKQKKKKKEKDSTEMKRSAFALFYLCYVGTCLSENKWALLNEFKRRGIYTVRFRYIRSQDSCLWIFYTSLAFILYYLTLPIFFLAWQGSQGKRTNE